MKTIKTYVMLAVLISFVTACKKEGPPGPAGADGNANVKSITITNSVWNYSAPSYYGNVYWSGITSEIINSGAVLVYVSTGSSTWTQLPLTFYPTSSYSRTFEVVTSLNQVTIFITDSDLVQPSTPGTYTFKIVAIAASGLAQHPGVDLNDYNAVKEAFNLAD